MTIIPLVDIIRSSIRKRICTIDNKQIITAEEVAELLRTKLETVVQEFENGRIRGFKIGGEWRTTEAEVWLAVTSLMSAQNNELNKEADVNPDNREDIPTVEQLKKVSWEKIKPFSHYWPNFGGEPAREEPYDEAYRATVDVNGKSIPFVIAFGNRPAAGMERRRCIVFWGEADRTQYPVVEFAGANDFEQTGKMASVIIKGGRKQVRPNEPLPADYQDMPTGVYNRIVDGPYASGNRCVIAHNTDFAVIIKHALIRCRDRSWV